MIRVGTTTGGIRVSSTTYAPSQPDETAPVLSAAHPTAFSVGSVDLSVTTNEGNGTLYVVVTDSETAPSAAQVIAGEDHTGSAAEADDSQAVAGTGARSFEGLTVSAGYWYAHFCHVDAAENESTVVSTVEFRVAGDDDGPDEWFWPAITTPAGDGVWPEGAEAGMPGWITRVSGGPLTVLSNGSTMSESDEWATEAQAWDWSLNDGLGGLSAVRAVGFALPVGGDAEITAVAGVSVTGQKGSTGSVGIGAEAGVSAEGRKEAYGTASITSIAEVTATGSGASAGSAQITAVAAVTVTGRKDAQGSASISAIASLEAAGAAEEPQEGSGVVSIEAVAGMSATGRKGAYGTAQIIAIASVIAEGTQAAPGSVLRTIDVSSGDRVDLGTLVSGDDLRIVLTVPDVDSLVAIQSAKFSIVREMTGGRVCDLSLGSGVTVTGTRELTIDLRGEHTESHWGQCSYEVEVRDAAGYYRTPVWGGLYLRPAIIANAS